MIKLGTLSPSAMAGMSAVMNAHQNTLPIFAIAVGYVLANRLAVPAEEQQDPRGFFRMQHQLAVSNLLSDLNEVTPFDLTGALANVQAFYAYRLYARNPNSVPIAFSKENALVSFFGILQFFPQETLALIEQDPPLLVNLIKSLTDLVDDLTQRGESLIFSQPSPAAAIAS